ncbi:hypothetical protein EMPS_02162 [Entomortierella parvispora]|uniref:F-box domain-containing protein n=1 Tax=Entomortierella parvispora TaxID=205924 RepID=A0A9P3H491_9FUNG|nr:hypothetical protein EMPS_02162 [Entomortierella parvispora]
MDKLELPPETLLHIGGFLERGSLANCIRVCKSWKTLLTPVLFQTIDDSHPQPPKDAIARHAHLVRNLHFSTSSRFQSSVFAASFTDGYSRCDNLKELDLTFDFQRFEMDKDRLSAKDLILKNQNLQKLYIYEQEEHRQEHRACWSQALARCNRSLKVLSLTNLWLSAEDTLLLWELAPSLQKLKLETGISTWSGSFATSPQFPQLTSLCFKDALPSVEQELEWIKQCPNLRVLDWSSSRNRLPSAREAFRNFGTYQWSYLQNVSIWGDTTWTDSQVACLLRSCGPLKCLRVDRSEFWYRSLDALERHFETLETLQLTRGINLRGWMIQWIMSSCPKLKTLISEVFPAEAFIQCEGAEEARRSLADMDDESDMTAAWQEEHDGETDKNGNLKTIMARFASVRDHSRVRPWVCLNLERLQVIVIIPYEADKEWDKGVFRQLSRLTKLTDLELHEEFTVIPPDSRPVRIDLKSGLGQLAPLRGLENFMFDGSEQSMERGDVQWILDHWPKLKSISSEFNVDADIAAQLQSLVRNAGRDIFMTTCFGSDLEMDDSNSDEGNDDFDSDSWGEEETS